MVRPNWLAALETQGWAVVLDWVPVGLLSALQEDLRKAHEASALTLAGVGRAEDNVRLRKIRRDKTVWLSTSNATQAAYLEVMEQLRLVLNANLFMGLWSFEAHYSVYESGGFYARHVDAFKGARNRLISTVLYLNEDWGADDGGELAIYGDELSVEPVIKVRPEFGSMAIFLSEDIPHEVLPTHRSRYSIAGWYRLNDRATVPALQVPGIAS